jgi:hypothetical protein
MTRYAPPFTLDYTMLGQVAQIAERLGRWREISRDALQPQLRRDHRIRSVSGRPSLGKSVSAIERAARRLRERGRLRHVGPQKGGHWEVV